MNSSDAAFTDTFHATPDPDGKTASPGVGGVWIQYVDLGGNSRRAGASGPGEPTGSDEPADDIDVATLQLGGERQWRLDKTTSSTTPHSPPPGGAQPSVSAPVTPPAPARTIAGPLKSILHGLHAPVQASPPVLTATADSPTSLPHTWEVEIDLQPVAEPSGKRPLSSFLTASDGAATEEAIEVARGLSVAAFRWPRIVIRSSERFSSEYAQVGDAVGQAAAAGHSLIAFSALRRNLGTTTTLLCVARQLAGRQQSVTLVDADFARPELAQHLGCAPAQTWLDVLTGNVPVHDVLITSVADGITLLPMAAAPGMGQSSTVLRQAAATAGVIRFSSDVALIDLGPLREEISPTGFKNRAAEPSPNSTPLDNGEPAARVQVPLLRMSRDATLAISMLGVDGLILVVDPKVDSPVHVQWAREQLAAAGCSLLGTIETAA